MVADIGGAGECLGGVLDEPRWGEGECRTPPAMDEPAAETDAKYCAMVAGNTDAKLGSKPGYLSDGFKSAVSNCGISGGREPGNEAASCGATPDDALGPKLRGFMKGR